MRLAPFQVEGGWRCPRVKWGAGRPAFHKTIGPPPLMLTAGRDANEEGHPAGPAPRPGGLREETGPQGEDRGRLGRGAARRRPEGARRVPPRVGHAEVEGPRRRPDRRPEGRRRGRPRRGGRGPVERRPTGE